MSMLKADRQRLLALKDKLVETFKDDLSGKKIIFIDYPVYLNVGDWLIYRGTTALFELLGCDVVEKFNERNYRNLLSRKIPKDWVLVLQGGGNFGDLYPIHQTLREKVLESFPDNKIILMPQSIHFDNPEAFIANSEIYRQHKFFKMYVRDHESYAYMANILGEGHLFMAPDMATMLIGDWEWLAPSTDTLLFRRRDIEASSSQGEVDNVQSFDWEQLFSKFDIKLYWWIVRLAKIEGKYGLQLGVAYFWDLYMARMLGKASRHYDRFGRVDTDRLHGMIFALLLGKDVVMQDNSYGKIRRYYSCWLS